jgi:hypothetical protein
LESGKSQGQGDKVQARARAGRHSGHERSKHEDHPQSGRIPNARQVIYLMRIILINRGNCVLQVNCFDSVTHNSSELEPDSKKSELARLSRRSFKEFSG